MQKIFNGDTYNKESTMFDVLISTGILVVFIVLWRAVGPRWQTIPEEKCHVIYRQGQFHRVLKSGTRPTYGYMEKVERVIDTREQPVDFSIPDLYVYDVPLGYTINFWYRLDPLAVAGNDKHKLRKLVQFDNGERHEQIRLRIKDLFIRYITEFQNGYQLPKGAGDMDKLYPFAPGQFAYQKIMSQIHHDLPHLLNSFGAILFHEQPIVLNKFHLAANVGALLERERTIRSLQRNINGLSPDMLIRSTGAFEGVNVGGYEHLVVTNNNDGVKDGTQAPSRLPSEEIARQHNMHRKPPRSESILSKGQINHRVKFEH